VKLFRNLPSPKCAELSVYKTIWNVPRCGMCRGKSLVTGAFFEEHTAEIQLVWSMTLVLFLQEEEGCYVRKWTWHHWQWAENYTQTLTKQNYWAEEANLLSRSSSFCLIKDRSHCSISLMNFQKVLMITFDTLLVLAVLTAQVVWAPKQWMSWK